ncbi:MAG: hypothetical protein K5694_05365 [Bacilli bacterium]|nr:hypothetical protein [Bacilli bacterium]
MKKRRLLLTFVATASMSVVAVGLANYEFNLARFNLFASTSDHHLEINKDTTLVPFEYSDKYVVPRGEGDDDNLVVYVTSGNRLTPFVLNYTDSFFFVPDIKYDDDYFKIFLGVNNLKHFSFDYYVSVNDSDNACTIRLTLYREGESFDTFIDTSFGVSRGSGHYEWTRPTDIDPSIKAHRLFMYFEDFKGTPTFRVNKIELDWNC